jgi:hypothetical protein
VPAQICFWLPTPMMGKASAKRWIGAWTNHISQIRLAARGTPRRRAPARHVCSMRRPGPAHQIVAGRKEHSGTQNAGAHPQHHTPHHTRCECRTLRAVNYSFRLKKRMIHHIKFLLFNFFIKINNFFFLKYL